MTGRRYYPHVHFAVLNSLQHGVPQNRRRLYICAVHDPVHDFLWPDPTTPVSLESCLDPRDALARPEYPSNRTELQNLLTCMRRLQSQSINLSCSAIADIGRSSGWGPSITHGHCPCLIQSRCKSGGYWCFSRQRRLRLDEYLRLQGIPLGRLRIPGDVSECQVRGMIGNSFTVPLIASIADRLLFSAGITCKPIRFQQGSGSAGMAR